MKSKNQTILNQFVEYCEEHPDERFWQALRNWSTFAFIYVTNEPFGEGETHDTFYFTGKYK